MCVGVNTNVHSARKRLVKATVLQCAFFTFIQRYTALTVRRKRDKM